MQKFLKLTKGYTYPAVGGGEIDSVTYVENQQMPTLGQYLASLPAFLTGGNTRLPKPVGADTKVPSYLDASMSTGVEIHMTSP
jgi:hypothetical protein